jgi:hypothetical protein
MKSKVTIIVAAIILATVTILLSLAGLAGAGPLARPNLQAGAPTVVSYQGQVMVDGDAYDGTGYFKFAVVNAAGDTTYWSNDGTSAGGGEPTSAVQLVVTDGLFNVLLGDTTLGGMTQALGADVFSGTDRTLRVWFSSDGTTFTQLSPDRRIAAVPYTLQAEEAKNADLLDGQHASAFASSSHSHDHGALTGLGDDDHTQYFHLSQDETVSGRPAFDGGTSGVDSPFTVDSTFLVTNLNADLLDGQHASAFASSSHSHDHGALSGLGDDDHTQYFHLSQDETVSGRPAFDGGTSGVDSPFTVDSTFLVTNLNAALLDGNHASAFQQRYANVVVVAKSGGDYTTITAALNSITDASDANRYLVKVMPGVYTERVTMKQYVDIEGAGELTTKITYTGSGLSNTGTVVGANNAEANNAEVRFLTVENTGGNTYAVAIYNSSASPRLTHLTATASGGGTYNYGVFNNSSSPTMADVTATASGGGTYTVGVYNNSSSPTMTNVTATASGGTNSIGVFNYNSSPTIQNSIIRASGGTNNYGLYNNSDSGSHTVQVNHSQITGSTNTILNSGGVTTRVGASLLDGGAVIGAGTKICAGVYDENYTFYASTCP